MIRLLTVLFCTLVCFSSDAAVLGLHVTDRSPVDYVLADSHPYELIHGQVLLGFDPRDRDNDRIVDLHLAPKNGDGLVTATANFVILRPTNPDRDADIALVEIPNRGGKAILRYLNHAEPTSGALNKPEFFGDGYLMRMGLTIVWIGWQADVPLSDDRMRLHAPIARQADGSSIQGLVRADWTMVASVDRLDVAHRGHEAYPIATDLPGATLTWRASRDGQRHVIDDWQPGADRRSITRADKFAGIGIHEFTYPARDPKVVGVGLATVRDFVSYLKAHRDSPVRVKRAIGVGISQTGRFLRHFVYQGFNLDERRRKVFDGLWIHTAGAGRGSFNHRFAQPSRDGHRYSAFHYPTDLFPFSGRTQSDPLVGDWHAGQDGLFAAYRERDLPKVMYTNTGYEYWGRAASLLHTTPDGAEDVALLPNERLYHIAGAQHYVHRDLPESIPGTPAFRGNWLDFMVNLRALAAHMVKWVDDDLEPPPSAYPTLASETLVTVEDYRWLTIAGLFRPPMAHTAHRMDYGPRWPQGIIDIQPPKVGPAFASLVPQLDASGNEQGGIRNVETRVPVASFLPWAMRFDNGNALEMDDFHGTVMPLPRTATEGDWRTPLDQLYRDQSDYMQQVDTAIDQLIAEGFVIEADRKRIIDRAKTNWLWSQYQ